MKVENGGAAEKSAVITNENCAPAADDSVDCAAVNPPAVVDGGAEAVNSVKPDSAASPLAPVSSPNPEGDCHVSVAECLFFLAGIGGEGPICRAYMCFYFNLVVCSGNWTITLMQNSKRVLP